MRPRRHRPTVRRVVLEYVAIIAVYFAAFLGSGGSLVAALIAMFAAMIFLRMTRPRPEGPPPPPPPGQD